MKPYERLASMYDKDWGKFSAQYIKLISHAIENCNICPHSILDVACGTGKLASELHKQNFEVSGIDISEDMISIARLNGEGIDFSVANMNNFNLNKKFDLITCAFDSINYLIEELQIKNTLENIYKHLNDNGLFIFDINTPILYEEKHFGIIDREHGEIKFKQILEYDKQKKIGTTIFDFGNNELEVHVQRAYSVEDMDRLLSDSGFVVLNRYKDFKLSPIDEKSYKIFYVVRKKFEEASKYL